MLAAPRRTFRWCASRPAQQEIITAFLAEEESIREPTAVGKKRRHPGGPGIICCARCSPRNKIHRKGWPVSRGADMSPVLPARSNCVTGGITNTRASRCWARNMCRCGCGIPVKLFSAATLLTHATASRGWRRAGHVPQGHPQRWEFAYGRRQPEQAVEICVRSFPISISKDERESARPRC